MLKVNFVELNAYIRKIWKSKINDLRYQFKEEKQNNSKLNDSSINVVSQE